MKFSIHIVRRLVTATVVSFAVAAIVVPASGAKSTIHGEQIYLLHGKSAVSAPLVTDNSGRYGPLDPWAYALVHGRQAGTTDNSGRYGPLDPWAYALVHGRQAGMVNASKALSTGAGSTLATGFDWRDAGIGAVVAFGFVAFTMATLLAIRKRGTLVHTRF